MNAFFLKTQAAQFGSFSSFSDFFSFWHKYFSLRRSDQSEVEAAQQM